MCELTNSPHILKYILNNLYSQHIYRYIQVSFEIDKEASYKTDDICRKFRHTYSHYFKPLIYLARAIICSYVRAYVESSII